MTRIQLVSATESTKNIGNLAYALTDKGFEILNIEILERITMMGKINWAFSGLPNLYYVLIAFMTLFVQLAMYFCVLNMSRELYMDSNNMELSIITKFCYNKIFGWFVFMPTCVLILLKFTCFKGKYETAYVWSMFGMTTLTVNVITWGILLMIWAPNSAVL